MYQKTLEIETIILFYKNLNLRFVFIFGYIVMTVMERIMVRVEELLEQATANT